MGDVVKNAGVLVGHAAEGIPKGNSKFPAGYGRGSGTAGGTEQSEGEHKSKETPSWYHLLGRRYHKLDKLSVVRAPLAKEIALGIIGTGQSGSGAITGIPDLLAQPEGAVR